jgi:hypothetical protein
MTCGNQPSMSALDSLEMTPEISSKVVLELPLHHFPRSGGLRDRATWILEPHLSSSMQRDIY